MKKIFFRFFIILICFLCSDIKAQKIYGWGRNGYGQVGIGRDVTYEVPVFVKNMSNAVSISAGASHSIALKNNGTVWAWGLNNYGQLGNGQCCGSHNMQSNLPVKVITWEEEELKDVIIVSTGEMYTLALKSDGTVWGWGGDTNCQLGQGEPWDYIPFAMKVEGIENVVDISAGSFYSLAVKADGTVWWWGGVAFGQKEITKCLPAQVPNLENVKAVEANYSIYFFSFYDFLALKNDGTLWVCDVLGHADKIMEGVKHMSTGIRHTLAVKEDGTVWAWGSNKYGQLGNGNKEDQNIPVKVQNISNVVQISAGWFHSIALDKDMKLWGWGNNSYGQLGKPKEEGEIFITPVQIEGINDVIMVKAGDYHTLVLKRDGSVYGFGANSNGQLGIGNLGSYYSYIPVLIPNLRNVISIFAGGYNSFAISQSDHKKPF